MKKKEKQKDKAAINNQKVVEPNNVSDNSNPERLLEDDLSQENGATKDQAENEKPPAPSKIGALIRSVWDGLILRQFFQKIFSLFFALGVFGAVYFYMIAHRNILTYMGVMLLMVIVYAEILVIRDHLWVIEGSMRESRRWRDIFFNQTSMRRQRVRKILVMIFALGIFSYVYMKSAGSTPILSFMGIILMITILYYEILTIRDEVFIMLQAIQKQDLTSQEKDREKVYEKFLESKSEAQEGEHEG